MRRKTHKPASQEALLRKIFEGSHDGIFVTDPNQDRILEVNPRACQMLGYTREELLGLPMSAIHPGEVERLQAFGDSVMEWGEGWTNELPCLTKQGKRLQVEISASVVDYDGRRCMVSMVRDISERVARERWQRVQSTALDAAGNAVVVTDREGAIQWVNPAFTRNTGYTLEEIAGGTHRILKSGEQSQGFYEDLWATITSGRTWTGELVNRRKDGSLYIDDQSITPITDEAGGITHFVAIKQDVTGERQLEEQARHELEMNRRQLAVFHELSSRLALTGDTDELLRRIVEDVSKRLRVWYGGLFEWDEAGRLIRSVMSNPLPGDLIRMDARERYRSIFEAVRGSGRTLRRDELIELGCDYLAPGEMDLQTLMAAPIQCDGEVRGILFAAEKEGASDFSDDDQRAFEMLADLAGIALENRRLHDGVEQREHMLKAVQAGMTNGLGVIDESGVISYFNSAAAALTGMPAEEVIGRKAAEVFRSAAPERERQESVEAFIRAVDGAMPLPDVIEGLILSPARREVAAHVFPIEVEHDRMIGVLMQDVTEERELERRKDAFVSVASHELRTPMTSLLGFSKLLLERDPPREKRREWLELIHGETQRLTTIVDDMLNVSRIQSSRITLNVEWVNVGELVREVAGQLSAASSAHHLTTDIAESVPAVSADREKLKQVLVNLMDNAIKYSPDGGTVTVSARPEDARKRVVVSVADEGMGIAPEDRDKLFMTFGRAERPEAREIRGTGLGLYIVKRFVEMMGGEIWVESELGQGSTFHAALSLEDITEFVGGGGERLVP